jgi:small-conductance mechanosensitive channel
VRGTATAPAAAGPITAALSLTSGHWADLLVVAALALAVRLQLQRSWARQAEGPARPYAQALVHVANGVTVTLVAGALAVALAQLALPGSWRAAATSDLLLLLGLALLYFTWRAAEVLVRRQAARHAGWANVQNPLLVLLRAAALVAGALVALKGLFPGVRLTAIWTTLGVGGVAVALALGDTLSNLFAGFYVLLDQPVRIGDLVALDSGETGYVQHVGWRSTRLRALNGTVVILPNTKLAKATITNHDLPDRTAQFTLEVAVGYEHDPEHIEQLLLEEVRAACAECDRLLAQPAPSVSFSPGFRPTGMHFTVVAYAVDYPSTFAAAAAIRKRVYRRFRAEGVAFPPPTQIVVLPSDRGGSAPAGPLGE